MSLLDIPGFSVERDGKQLPCYAGNFAVRNAQTEGDQLKVNVIANTERYMRNNMRVISAGVKPDNWLRGAAPILWEHNRTFGRTAPPIANGANFKLDKNADGITCVSHDVIFHGLTDLSKEIAALVGAGLLNTVSIAGMVEAYNEEKLSKEDIASGDFNPLYEYKADILKYDMIETSFCTVPNDPQAVVRASLEATFNERIQTAVANGLIQADGAFIREGLGHVDHIELDNVGKPMNAKRLSRFAAHLADVDKGLKGLRNIHSELSDKTEGKNMNNKPAGAPNTNADDGGDSSEEPTLADVLSAVAALQTDVTAIKESVDKMVSEEDSEEPDDSSEESADDEEAADDKDTESTHTVAVNSKGEFVVDEEEFNSEIEETIT